MNDKQKIHILTCVLEQVRDDLENGFNHCELYKIVDNINNYISRVLSCATVDGDSKHVDWVDLDKEFNKNLLAEEPI